MQQVTGVAAFERPAVAKRGDRAGIRDVEASRIDRLGLRPGKGCQRYLSQVGVGLAERRIVDIADCRSAFREAGCRRNDKREPEAPRWSPPSLPHQARASRRYDSQSTSLHAHNMFHRITRLRRAQCRVSGWPAQARKAVRDPQEP